MPSLFLSVAVSSSGHENLHKKYTNPKQGGFSVPVMAIGMRLSSLPVGVSASDMCLYKLLALAAANWSHPNRIL